MQLRILSPATRRLGLAMPFMLLMACSATRSYNDEFADVMNPYRNGQLKRAAKVMQESHSRDWRVKTNAVTLKMTYGDQAVLANLERGRLFFDAGMFSEAIEALEISETIINQDFNERAAISARDLMSETEAVLVNQKAMPYRGFVYDQLMIGTYKSLAAAFTGDLDRALVEARRIDENQEAAIRTFKAEVAGSSSAGNAWEELSSKPGFRAKHTSFGGADTVPASYAKFVNPYATLVKAVLRRLRNHSAETGEVDLRNLLSMMPDNTFVARELERCQSNESAAGTVYVLWENGLGPRRRSVEVAIRYGEIRAIFHNFRNDLEWFDTAFIALPEFVRGKRAAKSLVVEADGRRIRSQLICNMDMVERFEFEQRMPMVFAREVARLITQETLAHEVGKIASRNKGDGDGTIEVLALAATLAYRAVVNQADDRCWQTLAADYQFVALPIPGNRTLRLSLSGGKAAPAEVILPAGDAILLVVRSVNPSHISWHAAGFPLSLRGVG